jgi:hypothetical protein
MAAQPSSVDLWFRTVETQDQSVEDLTISENYDELENEIIMSQDQPIAVPRNIVALPKLCLKMIWKWIKRSFGSLRNMRKSQQWYDFWDDSTLLSRLSLREEGSLRRPPIVIEDGGVPSDIVISQDHRISLQKRYLKNIIHFWSTTRLVHFHDDDRDASGSTSQSYFLGPNQVVV